MTETLIAVILGAGAVILSQYIQAKSLERVRDMDNDAEYLCEQMRIREEGEITVRKNASATEYQAKCRKTQEELTKKNK